MAVDQFSGADLAKLEQIAPLLGKLLRQQADSLDAYLETVEMKSGISNTRAAAHCHFLALDGNGRPRIKDLIGKMVKTVAEYAMPRSEIARATKILNETGSPAEVVNLHLNAISLFSHLKNTGEGGELLLYLLAETFLGLPQFLCKMPLKTNSEVHYHGIDGIHVGVDESTGKLALYWGESKLYASVTAAITECLKSLSPFLIGDGGKDAPQERDLQLVRSNLDLNSPSLEEAFKKYLDPGNPLFKKLEYRGLCLVGFDADCYPAIPNSKNAQQIADEVKAAFSAWKAHIGNRVTEEKIETFVIEVFCLPFPSVEEFRRLFLEQLS